MLHPEHRSTIQYLAQSRYNNGDWYIFRLPDNNRHIEFIVVAVEKVEVNISNSNKDTDMKMFVPLQNLMLTKLIDIFGIHHELIEGHQHTFDL